VFLTDETGRIAELERYKILYSDDEAGFDSLTKMTRLALGVDISAITFIDQDFQWLKSRHGVEAREMPREIAFCDYTILQEESLIVFDATRDPRFADNPLVTGPPYIRSYLGHPLKTRTGYQLGSLCAISTRPRHFTDTEVTIVQSAASVTIEMLESRRMAHEAMPEPAAIGRAEWMSALASAQLAGGATVAMVTVPSLPQIIGAHGTKLADRVLHALCEDASAFFASDATIARLDDSRLGILLPGYDEADGFVRFEQWRRSAEGREVDLGRGRMGRCCVVIGLAATATGENLASLIDRVGTALERSADLGLSRTMLADGPDRDRQGASFWVA